MSDVSINLRVGKRWETAANKGRYLLLGQTKAGKPKVPSLVSLSTAPVRWQKSPELIYDHVHHVAGREADVRAGLAHAGLDEAAINKAIHSALTKKDEKSDRFRKQVEADAAKARKSVVAPIDFDLLTKASLALRDKNAKTVTMGVLPGKKKALTKGEKLKLKLEAIAKENREGAKVVINVSTANTRKQAVGDKLKPELLWPVKSIPIVSTDVARYRRALKEAMGEEAVKKHEAEIKKALEERKAALAGKKSRKRKAASKKAGAKKTAAKKTGSKKAAPTKKAAAKKTGSKAAPAKKAGSKAPAKKTASKAAPAKKAGSKAAPAKKAASKPTSPKKAGSKKAPASKSPSSRMAEKVKAPKPRVATPPKSMGQAPPATKKPAGNAAAR